MVLQQPGMSDPTCICGYVRGDLVDFLGVELQKPVGRKMLFHYIKSRK